MDAPFRSFEEFWPHYVGEHRRPMTRRLHFVGTTAGILFAIAAAVLLSPWLLLAVPVAAYGLAWIGHFFVEGNKPATFRHPLWSLWGDIRMYGLMWRGRMDSEVERLSRR
ncbi:MAG TPA: DUF962 domain-containing protein [Dongiaceae bacterium]|jgi:hypothetical protein